MSSPIHPPNLCYAFAPWLWVGAYPGGGDAGLLHAHMRWFAAQQIRIFIDLTAPSDDLPAYTTLLAQHFPHMTRLAFPINDDDIPSPPQMLAILDALHDAHEAGHTVYLHSWRGFGRTSMVVACWLIRQGYTATDALAILASIPALSRQRVPSYQVQIDFVMRWTEPDDPTAAYWRRLRNVFRGAFIGGAIGDAIGLTNELCFAPHIRTMDGIVGGGIFAVEPGTWTDDTSLMLCVADSLIAQHGFDANDQATRFVRWWRDGYLACGGRTYDIGNVTTMALFHYMQTGNPYSQVTSEHAAGTGAMIRMVPLGLCFATQPTALVAYATRGSLITHAAPSAVCVSQLIALMAARALFCTDKQQLFAEAWPCAPLHDAVYPVMAGSYRTLHPPQIINSTYVVRTLESVLWSLWHHDSYRSGVLALANLGGRSGAACTTYGQIAGAWYGEAAIPVQWIHQIHRRDEILWYAEMLLRTAWRWLMPQPQMTHLFEQPPSKDGATHSE